MALLGTEVKSLRGGRASFADSYAFLENGEAFLTNLDIPPYEKANICNHEPKRRRKLLFHKHEIQKLTSFQAQKGLALVPLQLYLNDKNRIKVEIGVCRGKTLYDKRRALADKESKKLIRHVLKS